MPYLIAMTPRAGRWNHRYLVPPDLNPSTEVLGRLTRMANQQPRGPAWLAVSHEVKQVGGGRTGQEMLILGDLNVERLTREARERLQELLRHRLRDLAGLITQQVAWEHEGRVDPVIRPELAQWYTTDFHPFGLLESRAPDWSPPWPRPTNDSKRYWMIGSAVGVMGLLLATAYYSIKPQIVNEPPYNSTKVDGIVCKMANIKPSGEDSACLLSMNDFKRLCDIFIPAFKKCEPQDFEVPLREIQEVRENFDFHSVAAYSHNDGFFDSALILTESKTDDSIRVLTEEVFGSSESGGRDISFDEYISVLKYVDKITEAWNSLHAFDPNFNFSILNFSHSGSWQPVDYDRALFDIRRFLNEIPEKMDRTDYLPWFSGRQFFDVECFRIEAKNKTPISSRLKCFLQENPDWKKLKSNKGTDQALDKYKSISLFEAILELRSPLRSP